MTAAVMFPAKESRVVFEVPEAIAGAVAIGLGAALSAVARRLAGNADKSTGTEAQVPGVPAQSISEDLCMQLDSLIELASKLSRVGHARLDVAAPWGSSCK